MNVKKTKSSKKIVLKITMSMTKTRKTQGEARDCKKTAGDRRETQGIE